VAGPQSGGSFLPAFVAYADAGDDTITAGAGEFQQIEGGDGHDSIRADLLSGAQGHVILGDAGAGDDGNDTIVASVQLTQVLGGGGDDSIVASSANSQGIWGDGGNDTLVGVTNDSYDYLDGGTGNDSITLADGNDAIGRGDADNDTLAAGDGSGQQLYGGLGDDSLQAGNGSNQLISGEDGNDTLVSGAGDDTLSGGTGTDWASYANAGSSVTVDLGAGSSAGADGSDILSGVEIVVGSNSSDTLIAGANNDIIALYGSDGGDSLVGGSADDLQLWGEGGADTLSAGTGEGQFRSGGEGNDSLLGSSAARQVLYGNAGNDTLTAGGGTGQALYGDADNDSLFGSATAEELDGGTGNDTLNGGFGDDTLAGGTGNDFASYADATGGVDANLAGNVAGAAGADSLFSVEGLIGSDFEDTLTGTTDANTLIGGNGIDSLDGNGGNDLLDYGAGDEEFVWGVSGSPGGAMTLLGGDGQDTLNLGGDWRSGPVTNNDWINFQRNDGSATVYSQGWENIVCFAEGTRIVTPSGEDAVENLRAGDMVLAMRDGQAGFEPLRWVGFMDVAVPCNATMAAKTAPILIKAGAIAPGMPTRDLRVSPDHAMEVDGHLIPAKHLVNGSSIIQETWCRKVRYFHLELEAHGLLLSEGTWSESYLDDGNRHTFNNTAMTGLFLDFEIGRSKGQYDHQACLPVLRQGLKLDEIQGRTLLRAAELAQPVKAQHKA
jgi:Ca2+-binding RTX toxin-like protein